MWEALLPSLISAGANIFGGMTSAQGAQQANQSNMQIANMNAQLQRETNWQNRELYFDNRDWQERMSNSAYQRQMQDMRMAGLNPILAYAKGGGASSPATNAPTLAAPQLNATMQNTESEKGRAIGAAANSAVSTFRTMAEVNNMEQNNKLIQEQQKKTEADTRFSNANTLKAIADTDMTKGQIANLPQILKLLTAQTTAAEAAAGASGAAAGASTSMAGLTTAQTKQIGEAGKGHASGEIQGLWRLLQGAIPTPKAPPVGKNANIPGKKSLWDLIKENLP